MVAVFEPAFSFSVCFHHRYYVRHRDFVSKDRGSLCNCRGYLFFVSVFATIGDCRPWLCVNKNGKTKFFTKALTLTFWQSFKWCICHMQPHPAFFTIKNVKFFKSTWFYKIDAPLKLLMVQMCDFYVPSDEVTSEYKLYKCLHQSFYS